MSTGHGQGKIDPIESLQRRTTVCIDEAYKELESLKRELKLLASALSDPKADRDEVKDLNTGITITTNLLAKAARDAAGAFEARRIIEDDKQTKAALEELKQAISTKEESR